MTEQPPATGDADYVAFVVAAWQRHQRLARLLTGDPSSADDLLQDALVKVYLRWRRLSRAGDPHGYLRRIMVNASTSRWRRGRREYLVDAPPDRPVSIGTGDHDDLRQALMSLPARQRAVVVLRYYEDLTERQTAEVMGCSVGTVKSQNARALGRLRALLHDGTEDGRLTRT